MDVIVMMRSIEDNPWGDKMLMGDICFIKKEEQGCVRTRSATGHPHRVEYWWVVDGDITVLSKGRVS